MTRHFVASLILVAAAAGCSAPKVKRATKLHDNGTLASRFSYYIDENEKPVYHGRMEKFYENGVKASSRDYVDGKVQGRAMFYLRTQETMYVTYKDDVANGPVEVFNNDGKRVMRGEFRAGKFHGPFVYYDADGKKLAEGRYDRGAPYSGSFVIGKNIATYSKGQLLKSLPMPGTAPATAVPGASWDNERIDSWLPQDNR
jgi:hypothetical protein